MELNIKCESCGGVDRCTNACYMHLGKALVDFIERVDMVQTRIGEYEARNAGGKLDLVVTGHEIFEMEEPTWILSPMDVAIDKSDKFLSAYNMTAFQIAKKYCESVGKTPEETEEITDKIKNINKNRLLIVPFKPHTPCNVIYNNNSVNDETIEANVLYIKWENNRETHKLDTTVVFQANESLQNKVQRYNISEYASKFTLTHIDIQAKVNKQGKSLIKVDNTGMIRPIVIKNDNVTVALDGTYLYLIQNNTIRIIGIWGNDNKLLIDKTVNNKALDTIRHNETYIKCHRKYIAPYMLYTPNIIEI